MSIKCQGHSLTFAKRHSVFKLKPFFSQKLLGYLKQIPCERFWEQRNEHLYNQAKSHDQDVCMPIVETLQKSSSPEPEGPLQ